MAMSYPEDEREPTRFEDDGHIAARPQSGSRSDDRFKETDELDLGDEDVRLPWLEGDDDDEFEDTGSNSGQLIGFAVLGLVALGLIAGLIWWSQRPGPDAQLVADGETIEAPGTPYKVKPENPGGDVVAGTGDTSFAVAEGQTRQVRIGNEPPPSSPKPSATPSGDATPAPSASAFTGASTDMTGAGVQVGAYSNRESAEKGWTRLSQQYDALSNMKYRIVEGRADIGTVYRLQAVPGDAAAANRLCATLKAAGLSCQVKR